MILCVQYRSCKSINVKSVGLGCEICGADTSTEMLVARDGWTHMETDRDATQVCNFDPSF